MSFSANLVFIALAAAQAVSVQPVTVAPVVVRVASQAIILSPLGQQGLATTAPQARKGRMLAEGRDLLARAQLKGRNYAPAAGQPTKAELDASIDQMKSDLYSMSEMGEMESLRLQMAMDRLSKMMSTLSNLLKKVSDTSDTITSNIK